jgi:pilus assembly protein CpaB
MIARRILIAFLIALFVSGLFTFLLSRKFAKPHTPTTQLQYIAPVKDIDAGEALKVEDVRLVSWPSSHPLSGAFVKPEQVVGRVALSPLTKDGPIVERHLAPIGAGTGLSAKIPDGMRAISLKSDQIVGVAGFLLPGTHVDVLVTLRTPGSTDAQTSTVLQDAEILAAGQKIQPDPEGKPTTVDVVTLLVDPKDAERVALASTQGSVHFVLRNGTDHQKTDSLPIQMSSLGFGAPDERHPLHTAETRRTEGPTKPKPYSVQIIRGDKQTVETF